MADDAHDMGLMALLIEGVAHRLTVDGESGVLLAIGLIQRCKERSRSVGPTRIMTLRMIDSLGTK